MKLQLDYEGKDPNISWIDVTAKQDKYGGLVPTRWTARNFSGKMIKVPSFAESEEIEYAVRRYLSSYEDFGGYLNSDDNDYEELDLELEVG